ncbi:hypothetical protein [Xanthocytophaga agilis]|uniref:Uncharacterized protein n=1 Tax=Xanthocytophaga agilis TaxID=3048010 RepID=A0AAE3UKB5_9BACT|nr:hypothetical protein [Xanthocytophaga agilis]MDJ1506913.1 hypothetical protein [Xanthocytophaga agilis]
MALSEHLQQKLNKKYAPSAMVDITYKGNDISFKTDAEGNPILLFIGRRDQNGTVKGERYARRFKRDEQGLLIKDHWELKGKAT